MAELLDHAPRLAAASVHQHRLLSNFRHNTKHDYTPPPDGLGLRNPFASERGRTGCPSIPCHSGQPRAFR